MLILNKYVRRFIDVPLLFICFFCRGRTMSWKKFCAIWREQLEVHNSLSVEMKSATLSCGQLSLVAGRGLRRHLCKCQAFVCTWGGFTWLLVTLPPPHVPHSLLFPSLLTPFLPLPAFLPSLGWQTLVISRYSGPGGSGFPLARRLCCMRIFMA